MGKVFRKAFRILGLDERKGRWVVEQDLHGNFLILVLFERSLYSVHVTNGRRDVDLHRWSWAAQGQMG